MFWAILTIVLLALVGYWIYVKNFQMSINQNTASLVAPYSTLTNSSMGAAALACRGDQKCTHVQCDAALPGQMPTCGLKQGQPQLVNRTGSTTGVLNGRLQPASM